MSALLGAIFLICLLNGLCSWLGTQINNFKRRHAR